MVCSVFRALKRILVLALFLAPFSAGAQNPNADIYGRWKITGLTDATDVVSTSDAEARALIGKPLLISREKFEFNGKKCMHPSYERSKVETVKHFRKEWQADSSDLGLPNPVTMVDNECYTLYLQRKHRLVIAVNSVFFQAARVRK